MNQTVVDKSTIFNNTKKSLATYDQNSLRNALREYSPNLTHKENFIIKVDAKLQLEKYIFILFVINTFNKNKSF